jgi:DUF4097 and DUF4098 domain-containing protein YvlB
MTTFTTPEPITATLTTAGARVRVVASERPDTVVRVEPVDGANTKVAEHTKVEFADGELSVKTTRSGDKNGSVAITVELPVGSRLVLNTAWTDVHANGLLGDCALNIASGRVQLGHVAALRGQLASGAVTVGHVASTADIDGGTAEVRLGEVRGTVRYEGSTGKVWIGHALSDVTLSSAGGSVDIERADGNVIAKSGNCPIRVGRLSRGQAELTNASGGIKVGIPEGTIAWVDAKSTKGTVRNSLPAPTPAEFDVKVQAHTRLDDIVIHRAA